MSSALADRGEFDLSLLKRSGETKIIKLKFSFDSMERMEVRMGCSLTKMATEVLAMNIRMMPIYSVVYEGYIASLPEKDTKLSEVEIKQMLLDTGFTKVAKQVMTFVMNMLTSGKEEVPEGKEAAVETPIV